MIGEAQARQAVDAVIATWSGPSTPEEQVVVWAIQEHARAWILPYATRRWLRTRAFTDILVGASPFVVDKATGEEHIYGSAPSECAKFEAWLDALPSTPAE